MEGDVVALRTIGLDLTAEQVEHALTTAGRAPSLHNSQPWSFRVRTDVIELHADPRRQLAVADPGGWEMRMSCGAALFTLRLALLDLGVRPLVTVLPDRGRPDLIAEVRRGGTTRATPEHRRLLAAVPRRRTNRHPFSDDVVTPAERYALRRAAVDEGAWLHFVTEPDQVDAVRSLAARAHREQAADPAFVSELRRWTGTAHERTDGVPAAAGGPRPAPQDQWVLRDFSAGTGAQQRGPGKDFESDPLIAVLTSHLSGPRADVRAGEALQRVLLTATADGLSASFLSHIVEVEWARSELRRLIAAPLAPHVVLRIGRGWPVVATPRHPVADLLAPTSDPGSDPDTEE
jgi:hypothetical protein